MANGCSVTTASRKMIVRPGEQNIQSDFVRCLLPRRAFDQRDHAVEKSFAGIRSDLDLDVIAKNARAAGDGGTIASGFANHGSGFAGDGGFVDRRDAFDNLAVAGNEFSGSDRNQVAGTELGAGNFFDLAVASDALGDGFRAGAPQAFPPAPCRGLRPWLRRSWQTER